MPDTINSISPSIRDFLLNRNLILSDTITKNGLSSLATGLGRPVDLYSIAPNVKPSVDIMVDGPIYRDLNQLNNPYSSVNGDELIEIKTTSFAGNLPIGTSQLEYPSFIGSEHENTTFSIENNLSRKQLNKNKYITSKTYIDEYNNLNASKNLELVDFIGSALNGGKSFDIKSSLVGRVLTETGVLNDSPIGIIANRELLRSLKNKAIANTERELLGKLNLNPISLLSGNKLIEPDYSITVGKSTGKKILDVGLNLLGIESPTSYLFEKESSIFYDENKLNFTERTDSQLANSGRGQVMSLFSNLDKNKYKPTISDKRFKRGNGSVYLFEDIDGKFNGDVSEEGTLISKSNINSDALVRLAGFDSLKGIKINEEIKKDGSSDFIWSDDILNTIDDKNTNTFNENTLLGKTQKLFGTNNMQTLVSGHYKLENYINEVTTSTDSFISKGSGVLSKDYLDNSIVDKKTGIFCRTWTSLKKYNQVNDLQKHSGLYNNKKYGLRNRQTTTSSVLDTNGFVRIAPNTGDDKLDSNGVPKNIKKFMFSLENLAWADDYKNLPDNEKGYGDAFTKTKGRIMWFPPYDLLFSESTSVNFDSHTFIGRGEPLYTYNNSERSGTLSFKIIMDHASYMNDLPNHPKIDEMFASIVAGCYDFDAIPINNLTRNEKNDVELQNVPVKNEKPDEKGALPDSFTIYFPNDVASLDKYPAYESNGDVSVTPTLPGLGLTYSDGYTSKKGQDYPDTTDYGLNKIYLDPAFRLKLKADLKNCPSCKINIGGYASTDGTNDGNSKLIVDRAENVRKWFKANIIEPDDVLADKRFASVKGISVIGCDKDSAPVDAECKKIARKADITFTHDAVLNQLNIENEGKKDGAKKEIVRRELSKDIKSRFFNESLYFQKLEQDDKFIYDTIKEKIKYFHPAFHSITPEGFNSRLTFLQQCTRQGPTKNSGVNNLAFGMAPVVILRIGDLYHTKIIIENLDINFDSGSGIQWDLNPEGVGVQPMIANISISFKFIGGQSLDGPINKLQNAISFNFFANTEIYDPRADYIKTEVNEDSSKTVKYVNDEINFNEKK